MIEILVFLTNFINWKISLLSIADWALITLDVIAIIKGYRFRTDSKKIVAGMFLIAGALLSFVANIFKSYFVIYEFIQSGTKLFVYIFSIGILPQFIKEREIDVADIIKKYIYLVCICALFQHIVVYLLGRESWPLYSLGSEFFGYVSESSLFDSGGIMRARTFYMEPGPMAVHISMLFSILLFTQKKLPIKLHVIYIICVASTISLSALITAFFIYALYFFNIKNQKNVLRLIFGWSALIILICAVYLNNEYIRNRIIRVMQMQDYSSVLRTFGTLHALIDAPWYGVGIGNNANYFKRFGKTMWYNGTGEFYNVIIIAAITIGYLGMIGILLYQYYYLRHRLKLLFAFMITQCGWGYLFSTPGWTFLVLSSVLIYYADNKKDMLHKSKDNIRSLKGIL